jgi:hypothetical protein
VKYVIKQDGNDDLRQLRSHVKNARARSFKLNKELRIKLYVDASMRFREVADSDRPENPLILPEGQEVRLFGSQDETDRTKCHIATLDWTATFDFNKSEVNYRSQPMRNRPSTQVVSRGFTG